LSTTKKLSFVFPITLKEDISSLGWRAESDSNAEFRFGLLIKSFLKYFAMNDLAKFLILCPAQDVTRVEQLLRALTADARFVVMDEKVVCPELDDISDSLGGWYIQQILKISVAKYFDSEFYVTFDSDVICKKHFDASTLAPGGKAYTNIEKRAEYDDIYNESFAKVEWKTKNKRFIASAVILKYKRAILFEYKRRKQYLNTSYGETPVLLHTKSVIGLINELSSLYRNGWVQQLSTVRGWTEYTLYFLYMEKHNIFHKYHQPVGRNVILDLDSSVWHTPEKYKQKKVYSPQFVLEQSSEHGYFVAIQSYLDSDKWLPESCRSIGEFYAGINDILFTDP